MRAKKAKKGKPGERLEAEALLALVGNAVVHLENCVAWNDDMGTVWAGPVRMDDAELAGVAGQRPRANILQRRVVRAVEALKRQGKPIRLIALKGRRSAASTICAKIVDLECRLVPGTRAGQMGDEYARSDEVFGMTSAFARSDVYPWGFGVKVTDGLITYGNGPVNEKTGLAGMGFEQGGSEVVKETAKDVNAGRGGGFRLWHFTEAAHYPDVGVRSADKLMLATLNTVPKKPGTMVLVDSTAKGRAGWYYGTWQVARWPEWETYYERYGESEGEAAGAGGDGEEVEWVRVFAAWYEIARNVMTLGVRAGLAAGAGEWGIVDPFEALERAEDLADVRAAGAGEGQREGGTEGQSSDTAHGRDARATWVPPSEEWQREAVRMWRSLAAGTGRRREAERQGMSRFGWTLEQIKWRRWTIANDFSGKEGDFAQEYPSTPEDAFRLTGACAFSSEALGVLRGMCSRAVWRTGVLEAQGDGYGRGQGVDERGRSLLERVLGGYTVDLEVGFRPTPEEESWVRVVEPPTEGSSYVICCDPASGKDVSEGRGDLDLTSVLVLRAGEWVEGKRDARALPGARVESSRYWRRPRVVCRISRVAMGCRPADKVFFWMLALVCHWYGLPPLVVETNKGEWVIVGARAAGLNLWRRQVLTGADSKLSGALGLYMTEETRHSVVTRLQGAVHGAGSVDAEEAAEVTECVPEIEIEDLAIVEEMEVFVRDAKGKFAAAPRKHDDDVLCLGIGVFCLENAQKLIRRGRRR